MDFQNNKKRILENTDLSKKGSIDEAIVDLVRYINDLDDYVTTSSCSGRSILFLNVLSSGVNKKSKRDCKWMLTSHDMIDSEELVKKADPSEGDLQFKFEPFILHVQCSNLEKAQNMQTIALGCGFRESGLTVGKQGKITLAIRSNVRLEVPLSLDGVMLVSDVYLKFLADQANEKMRVNQQKVKHFCIILKEVMERKEAREKEKE